MIVCMGIAGRTLTSAGKPPPVGQYLKSYDPEAYMGRGTADWTAEAAEALRFPSAEAAHDCWLQVPANRRKRPDGKLNRPLTAFTVQIRRA